MKYGLVLAGGGVRGAFQMGVWKALRRLNIKISAVTGTSIGAINGALIAQDEYSHAMRMWREISAEDIIAMPAESGNSGNIFSVKNISAILKQMRENDGLNMKPLENILRGIIDEKKLRQSPVGFGMAAYSLTDKKGIYKFKEDIPDGEMIDYIMASASILTVKKIGAEKFSDGALYDNMPVSMLIQKGIDDIITVDVRGIGINRPVNMAGRNIISIRSKTPQTGIMDFDSRGIARSIDEGYLACLRAFGRVSGGEYSFYTDNYLLARERFSEELIDGVRAAAKIFGLNPLEIYTFDGLCAMVTDRYRSLIQRGGYDVSDMSIEKIKKEGGDMLVAAIVKAVESGKSDMAKDSLSLLGAPYDAASAILYLKRKNN